MRRFIGILIICFTFFPAVAFAADISDCADDSLQCHCPPDIGTGDLNQIWFNEMPDPIDQCIEQCRKYQSTWYSNTGFTVEHWVLQCSIDDEQKIVASNVIDQDEPISPEVVELAGEAVEEEEKPMIVPNLGVDIPGLELSSPYFMGGNLAVNWIGEYVAAMYAWLIGAGAILAVVMLMVGGLEWMLAAGSPERVGKAKTRIGNAFTGMVLLLCSYVIAFFIDPNTVAFKTLEIQQVERADFIPNDTPLDFPIIGQGVISSEAAEGGVGWNDFKIFDQTQYGLVPYGSQEKCFEPATFDSNGKRTSNGSGNILSSGCGVASFAGVISTIGSQGHQTPDLVAEAFYNEGHRPINSSGCGYNGTYNAAFYESSLLADNDLYGEYIHIGDVGAASTEARQKILAHLTQDPIEPVIVSYRTETGGGHYVVLVGVEGNNFLYNNPWGGNKQIRNIEEFFTVIKSAVVIRRVED